MASWRQDLQGFGKRTGGALSGFKAFILRGNVVDLAVGIVIGVAFGTLVTSFVSNIITPLIPAPGGNLSTWAIPIPYNNNKPLMIGTFINAIIAFLIIAAVIYYFVVLPVNALMARFKPKEVEAPPTTRDCPYCLSSVPLQATRCAYCTSPLPPPGETAQPILPAQQ
jgi:large conductance mechanosensitive channel